MSLFDFADEEYYQLPDVFDSDNYEKCLSQRHNAFCAGVFELAASGPSQVYDVLKSQRLINTYLSAYGTCIISPSSTCRKRKSAWFLMQPPANTENS
ncbi:hypothetical protein EVAR_46810_1 [Eumeta japonica]|uniref:Uncharacterized protein n=1 Tax=Eumeta variegata TaxID=151549 RepID=A0A4C1XCK6_EUMVA|nr:hypothetical protein EVAR_46810_1 [Eumeta japonica]